MNSTPGRRCSRRWKRASSTCYPPAACLSNYLALGAGRAFLINDIEVATAQLWVRPDRGVRTFADLRGKAIATTAKTIAHIFLDRALHANGIKPTEIHAQQQHVGGGGVVRGRRGPGGSRCGCRSISSCARRCPTPSSWSTRPPSIRNRRPSAAGWRSMITTMRTGDVLARIIRGWAEANDYMVRNSTAAAEALQKNHYERASHADVIEALKAQKMYSSREWKRLYQDGTVAKWLQQASDFFMADAGVAKSVPASEYFDPQLYLSTIG